MRPKVSDISAWLTGHQQYKWLEIHRDDLEHVRYKAIITHLEPTVLNGDVFGFRAANAIAILRMAILKPLLARQTVQMNSASSTLAPTTAIFTHSLRCFSKQEVPLFL